MYRLLRSFSPCEDGVNRSSELVSSDKLQHTYPTYGVRHCQERMICAARHNKQACDSIHSDPRSRAFCAGSYKSTPVVDGNAAVAHENA